MSVAPQNPNPAAAQVAVDASGNVYALQGASDASGLGGASGLSGTSGFAGASGLGGAAYMRPGANSMASALNAQRTQTALAQRQAVQVCARP